MPRMWSRRSSTKANRDLTLEKKGGPLGPLLLHRLCGWIAWAETIFENFLLNKKPPTTFDTAPRPTTSPPERSAAFRVKRRVRVDPCATLRASPPTIGAPVPRPPDIRVAKRLYHRRRSSFAESLS